jgi:hypothetical protein
MRLTAATGLLLAMAGIIGGCPPEDYDNLQDATLVEVNRIRNDDTLSAQEMRLRLLELGLSPSTINGLLRGERLGNQYGGDLRTAYQKVKAQALDTLTADEIQIYADEASAVDTGDDLTVTLTDSDAQAILELFEAHAISTPDELADYLANTGEAISERVPDTTLEALFIDFDPDLLLTQLP